MSLRRTCQIDIVQPRKFVPTWKDPGSILTHPVLMNSCFSYGAGSLADKKWRINGLRLLVNWFGQHIKQPRPYTEINIFKPNIRESEETAYTILKPHHGRLLERIIRLASTLSRMGSLLELSVRRCVVSLPHLVCSPDRSHENFCVSVNMLFVNSCMPIRLCDYIWLPRWLANVICG